MAPTATSAVHAPSSISLRTSEETSTTIQQGELRLGDLVARIQAELPDLSFAKATLNDEGEDHAVVVLDDCWVFRFPRTAEVEMRGAPERRLLAELNTMTSVATPHYEHVSPAGHFSGYRFIAGRGLTRDVFDGLSTNEQKHVLAQIGDFLRALHALPSELLQGSNIGGCAEDAAWFARRHKVRREALSAVLCGTLLASANRFYEALPAAVATNDCVVSHRDFTENHILIDPRERRLSGVIDFSDAALSDPAFDFAGLWAYGGRAPAQVASAYAPDLDTRGILERSLWWFTRYRLDQAWLSTRDATLCNLEEIRRELKSLFDNLGL